MIKNRNENEVVKDKYKNNEIDFTNFNDNVTPNHYSGRNNIDIRLEWRNLGS